MKFRSPSGASVPLMWPGVIAAALLLLTSWPLHLAAQTAVWTGGGTDELWSTSANWSGTAPTGGSTRELQFGGTQSLNPDNDLTNVTANGITFNSGAGSFILTGNALTLGGNISNNSSSLQTINLPLVLSGTRTLTPGTGGLVIGGEISGGFGLTKSGNGTLTLSGPNSYTGQFDTGTAGIVVAANDLAFGAASGGVLVRSGAAVQLDGVTITGETITLNGSGISDNSGALRVVSQNGEWAGTVVLGSGQGGGTVGGARLGSLGAGSLEVSGNIIDNGGNLDLAIRSSNGATGKIILSGTGNSYRDTYVVVGHLQLGVANALPIATTLTLGNSSNQGSVSFDLNGFSQEVSRVVTSGTSMGQTITNSNAGTAAALTIRGSGSSAIGSTTTTGAITGNLALIKEGTGALTLSGNLSTNSYTGLTSINAGNIIITKNSALGSTAAGTEVASGAALYLQNGVTVGAETLSLAGTGLGGTGALRSQTGANSWGGAITLTANSEIQIDQDSSLTIDVASGSAISGTFNLTFDVNGSLTIADAIATGTGTVSKSGAGTLTYSGAGANTYTGTTTINTGTVVLSKSAGVNAIAGSVTIGNNSGGQDILRLGQSNQIIDTAVLTFNGQEDTAGIFQLFGYSETVGGIASTGGDGIIENEGGGTSTLTINTATSRSFSGVIRDGDGIGTDGVLALTKSGAGELTLSGANSYSGVTTVTGGILKVTSATALGSTAGATVVNGGARVELTGGVTVTGETITITGNGGAPSSAGALRSSGAGTNTWAGPVILGSGTGSTGSPRVGATGGGTLVIGGPITDGGNGVDLSIRPDSESFATSKVVLSGTGSSYKDTYVVLGTLELQGADDILPTTTIVSLGNGSNSGFATWDLGGTNQRVAGLAELGDMNKTITNTSGTTSTLTVQNTGTHSYGTLAATGPKVGGIITGNLNLTKSGAGRLILGKANSYTGKTTVSGGSLELSGTGTIDATSWIELAGGIFDVSGRSGGGYIFAPAADAPFSGTGTVEGNLTLGGGATVRAGSSSDGAAAATAGDGHGVLKFQNNLTLQGGASSANPRVVFSLAGATGNTDNFTSIPASLLTDNFGEHDALDVDGALAVDAGSTMKVVYESGYAPVWGDVFNLMDWGSLNVNADGIGNSFTLSDLDLSAATLGNGWSWNTDYFISHGVIVVVPEPSRAILLLFASLALMTRRRRIGSR